jgi:precorrin-2 dehydrogenase/sirohydrochlorin ferrochelatase
LLVDLNLCGKEGLVIASGDEAEIRAKHLATEGANVTVLTVGRPNRSLLRASKAGEIRLLKDTNNLYSQSKSLLNNLRPFLVVISTGSLKSDQDIAEHARTVSRLVYVVDRPKLNDLNMTGIAKIGDIRVAVSTQGLSPAMAGLLRRKIESKIEKEDVLQVRLQGEIRGKIKQAIKDPSRRKKLIYRLINSKKILSLLRSNRFNDAKSYALSMIASTSKKEPQVVHG